MTMRNLFRLATALCLALVACLALPVTNAAAASGFRAQTGPCPGAASYPVTTTAMIKSSTTTPYIGEKIEVSGQTYCPNEDVKIYLDGHYKTTAHTDASGSFGPQTVAVGGPAGDQTLTGVGASGLSNDRDSLVLHVRASQGTAGEAIGGSGSGSGLSSTGTDIALLVGVAVLLLGGGAALTVTARRRRASV
jgi:hypothetical protein